MLLIIFSMFAAGLVVLGVAYFLLIVGFELILFITRILNVDRRMQQLSDLRYKSLNK
jgi:hypothetical protein